MKNSSKIIICVFMLINSSLYAENTGNIEDKNFFCCSIYDLYKTHSFEENSKISTNKVSSLESSLKFVENIKVSETEIDFNEDKIRAYKDEDKFYTGPWCKKGDWVIFARYAGSRLPIEGGEVRLLNDDEVLGTIKNPEDILHHI